MSLDQRWSDCSWKENTISDFYLCSTNKIRFCNNRNTNSFRTISNWQEYLISKPPAPQFYKAGSTHTPQQCPTFPLLHRPNLIFRLYQASLHMILLTPEPRVAIMNGLIQWLIDTAHNPPKQWNHIIITAPSLRHQMNISLTNAHSPFLTVAGNKVWLFCDGWGCPFGKSEGFPDRGGVKFGTSWGNAGEALGQFRKRSELSNFCIWRYLR